MSDKNSKSRGKRKIEMAKPRRPARAVRPTLWIFSTIRPFTGIDNNAQLTYGCILLFPLANDDSAPVEHWECLGHDLPRLSRSMFARDSI